MRQTRSLKSVMNQDMERFRAELSGLAPTEMERSMLTCIRKIYRMTEKGTERWSRRTKAKVRAIIEGALEL